MDVTSVGIFIAGLLIGLSVSTYLRGRFSKTSAFPRERRRSLEEISESEEDDYDSEDASVGDENYKMVIVVNESLKMGKGKIAAQCCHGCLGSFKRCSKMNPIAIQYWKAQGQPKIALKGKDTDELRQVAQLAHSAKVPFYMVQDAGRTQVAPGSITVCALGPALSSEIDKITASFKLL